MSEILEWLLYVIFFAAGFVWGRWYEVRLTLLAKRRAIAAARA